MYNTLAARIMATHNRSTMVKSDKPWLNSLNSIDTFHSDNRRISMHFIKIS